MASAHVADVHASVSKVFGAILREREGIPVNAIWPPILWSNEFRADPDTEEYVVESRKLRLEWTRIIEERDGFTPRVVFMFAGRWAEEKRIVQLFSCVPDGCALIVFGDGTSEYSEQVATGLVSKVVVEEEEEEEEERIGKGKGERRKSKQRTSVKPILGVLPLRKMLNATELRIAYQACDVFVSASAFETLGNTVVEALCCGTPVAVQPAQGHLEYVVDGENSYFVDYDDAVAAKQKLTQIAANIQGDVFPPKLKEVGQLLRKKNFALEFHDVVLQPAFDARARRDMYHNKCRFLCETVLIRPLSLIAWILLWLIMRIGSRCVYCFSNSPSFVILDHLGGSIETQRKKTSKGVMM
jgi:glycosyltransferase involved in cell wall biosynthesis